MNTMIELISFYVNVFIWKHMKNLKLNFLKEFKKCVDNGLIEENRDDEEYVKYMDEFEEQIDYHIEFHLKNDALYYKQEVKNAFEQLISFRVKKTFFYN